MKSALLLLTLLAVHESLSADPDWENYKRRYSKRYASSDDEKHRHQLFNASKARVASRNRACVASGDQPVFCLTKFSDREDAEISVRLGGRVTSKEHNADVFEGVQISCVDTVDWRQTPGVVSWVRDQGQCGACWAFSTAETVSSHMVLAGQPPMEYSPQQLAANAQQPDNPLTPGGCGGGDPVYAYKYITSKAANPLGGLASDPFCPYTQSMWINCDRPACTAQCGGLGPSWWRTDGFPVARISGFEYAIPPCYQGSCDSTQAELELLRCAIAENGPASVCLNADAWGDYTGGIMSAEACGPHNPRLNTNHCVQLVGYHLDRTDPLQSYWLVRNSWSTDWGEGGYIRLQLSNNTCGVANVPTFPKIIV